MAWFTPTWETSKGPWTTYNQSLPLTPASGGYPGEATTLNNIGRVYSVLGDKQTALDYLQPIFAPNIGKWGYRWRSHNPQQYRRVYDELGDKQTALDYYNQSLPLSRQVGDKVGKPQPLTILAGFTPALGDKQTALDYYNQSLPLSRQVGDISGEAATLNDIGVVYDDLGEKQTALDYFNQSLPLTRQVGR